MTDQKNQQLGLHITKKKGLIYRGMSNQEFTHAKKNKYFRSSSTVLGTYASNNPYTAECYAEYLAPKGKTSSTTKPTYVVVFNKNDLNIVRSKDIDSFIKFCKKLNIITTKHSVLFWQSLFKKYVSGDDHLIIGKIPFSKTKEIYNFSMGKWIMIK